MVTDYPESSYWKAITPEQFIGVVGGIRETREISEIRKFREAGEVSSDAAVRILDFVDRAVFEKEFAVLVAEEAKVNGSATALVDRPPSLREQMIIYILLAKLPNGFSLDDIPDKHKIVSDNWDQQRKAPLGDAGRRVNWSVPSPTTVRRAIEKYLRHPERFPNRR